MYQRINPVFPANTETCVRLGNYCIPFALDNTDYQTFKAKINADEAELQDADGKKMTAKAAKAFVADLP